MHPCVHHPCALSWGGLLVSLILALLVHPLCVEHPCAHSWCARLVSTVLAHPSCAPSLCPLCLDNPCAHSWCALLVSPVRAHPPCAPALCTHCLDRPLFAPCLHTLQVCRLCATSVQIVHVYTHGAPCLWAPSLHTLLASSLCTLSVSSACGAALEGASALFADPLWRSAMCTLMARAAC